MGEVLMMCGTILAAELLLAVGALHPKRALYNKVYRKTTFGLGDLLKRLR
jgi:hypothetical protein